MGQYFMWLNAVKGEYIEPIDFDLGNKRRESSWVGCEMLDVLFTLMSDDWENDPIVWIGDDYTSLKNETNLTLATVEKICGSNPYDYAIEHFKNVSCQFHSCDKYGFIPNAFHIDTLKMYGVDNEDLNRYFERCDDLDSPLYYRIKYLENFESFKRFMVSYLEEKDMFSRMTMNYHLIINDTKKEFIDTDRIIPDENGYRYNPFPALMIKEDGRYNLYEHTEDDYCGSWLGDKIHISNDIGEVPEFYKDVSNYYTWENGY